ncbi:FAD-dependent oxidoreductase [Neorhodopirellula pilleata]|uniref:Arylsulfatase n=1 Tax=Neorhodopirellula pilleata TaxID=2714738 RepID=A0A5C6ABL6_9BACT|nr:FAD-dependent oxidoreductase [Neorhodopirellula pilleata]TWT97414.1 Arylsulfatase [Neorhodopirellula pilleata]
MNKLHSAHKARPRLAILALAFFALTLHAFPQTGQAEPAAEAPVYEAPIFDVVVYGDSCGAVTAAISAKRQGRSVILVNPTHFLGGMSASGLGATDFLGRRDTFGGIASEFYDEIAKHYGEKFVRSFEPHVGQAVFKKLIDEADVPVVFNAKLNRESGVEMNGRRIVSITTLDGQTYRGKMFIDATYVGDLMAAAGVTYTVGREPEEQYGESLAGVRRGDTHPRVHYRQGDKDHFIVDVDPYIVPGKPDSGLLPHVHKIDGLINGQGDRKIQAYNYRLCLTSDPELRIPIDKPSGYRAIDHELLLRNFEAGDSRLPALIDSLAGSASKVDWNNMHAVGSDYDGANWDYPEASYEKRREIEAAHELYIRGFLWTLANSPRVPAKIRTKVAQYGLPNDEFTDNGGWPYMIYIREARRMIADYVMTQADCEGKREAQDPVGLGSFGMDSHVVQFFVNEKGFVRHDGVIWHVPPKPYGISYRSIVPRNGECENVFAPICLSTSHVAHGSIRMEPVFMTLSESAAIAASLAIKADVSVQNVQYADLRQQLDANKIIVQWNQKTKAAKAPPKKDSAKTDGNTLDDPDTERIGEWKESTFGAGFIGDSYLHDDDHGKGEKKVRFKWGDLKSGLYDVHLAYTSHTNRATNVTIAIHHANGESEVVVNQQKKPADSGWHSLGRFSFSRQKPAIVEISNAGTDGYVIADAVRFVPVMESDLSHDAPANTKTKPNILIILADDLGIECLSAYGGKHATPNIDAIAAQGMRFTHCFSNPFCSPSRASLLTGRYPFKNGLTDVLHSRRQENIYLSPDQPSFARQLKTQGYATAIAGKWHMSLLHRHNTINAFGFDQYQVWQIFDSAGEKTRRFWKPHINRNGRLITEQVLDRYGPDVDVEFLTEFMQASVKQKQPFLAYFATPLPHFPWEPTPDSIDLSYRKPHSEHKGDPKYFPDMVQYLDKCIGQLLQTLDDQGIAENTVVFFLADNGTDRDLSNTWGDGKAIQGGKGTMTDRGTHVPLLVRWPKQISAGSTCSDLIDFSDLLPTLCDLSGAPLPTDKIHGRSFVPQLLGKPSKPREWVHVQHQEARHVRSQSFILNNKNELRPVVELWEPPARPLRSGLSDEEKITRNELNNAFDQLDE